MNIKMIGSIAFTALVAGTIAAGVVLLMWLRADNDRLEERMRELQVDKMQLQERTVELQAEGERLKAQARESDVFLK